MAKEQFFYGETQPLFDALEELSHRSGVSRGQAFEDWLIAMVCALAAETMEDPYLQVVERHKAGKAGKRGIDLMGQMFGQLVVAMEKNSSDVLGDLFQGSITYGERGQYFTPESLTRLLAEMTIAPDALPSPDRPLLINDPCCGTGRMLLAASNVNPHAELVGQDIDARCARITAINLGLRGRYGWVVCGNSLSGDTRFAYRIGSFFHESSHGLRRGVIRQVPPEHSPVPVIAKHAREKSRGLFDPAEKPKADVSAAASLPAIIEVPPWLARLEPALGRSAAATQPMEERPRDGELPTNERQLPPERSDGPYTQRELF